MASYGQMQQRTAYPVLGGTHNSQHQTYGASPGLPARQGSQVIPTLMSGVQHNVPMNSNAMHPTTFPPVPGHQSIYPVQVPIHGPPMAFHQPLGKHVNAREAPYDLLPNTRRGAMNVFNGSHPAQESAFAPQLGVPGQAMFLQNPGQRLYVHSRSTVQQNSAMGFGGHNSSQHTNFNPAFGAQAYGATPQFLVQSSHPGFTHYSVPVQDFGAVHNFAPMQNHPVNHSRTITYNSPYAMTTQSPVTHNGYSIPISQPSGPPTSYPQTSQDVPVSHASYIGQQTSTVYNEAYPAASSHSGQGQLQPDWTDAEGQRETQGNTTSIETSTDIPKQGYSQDEGGGDPVELFIEPQLESSTSDAGNVAIPAATLESHVGNATVPAETLESTSSEQSSSPVGVPAPFQPRLDGPDSTSSDILKEEKLDGPTDKDGDAPEAAGASKAPTLADMIQLPDEITREFSRFVDDAFPELVPADDPPALTKAEWYVRNMLGNA